MKNTGTRREFMRRLAARGAALTLGMQSRGNAAVSKRPNVLLIMVDDLGVECLGSYGGTSYATPNLDALANSGIRFTDCHSNPKCSPSRVNIMTGRYGFRTGQVWGHIPDEEITFGTVLSEAGYATGLAGKWQMALLKDDPTHPRKKGFQESSCWAWHEGPRYWNPMLWQNGQLRSEDIAGRYGPDVFTEFLTDFMGSPRSGPFFAYYPMCLTHFPKKGGQYKEPFGPNGRYQTFGEMVERMDSLVGQLVRTLDDLGIREDTLILFTADNGTPKQVTSTVNGREVQGGKGLHTDAGTHVPLIASWPGTTPVGKTCGDLVDFSDFMPTLAEAADATLPQDRVIDGRSFLPQLKGQPGKPRDWIYTEYEGLAWIRNKRWKLYSDDRFFDMKQDPQEEVPLVSSALSEEAKRARDWLKREIETLRNSALQTE